MFKRDIIVKFGSLDALVRELNTYIGALDDIRSSVTSIMHKIEAGRGLTTENLKGKNNRLVYLLRSL